MISKSSLFTLLAATLAAAGPVTRRQVPQLNQEAFEEAHTRDDGATRAFSDVQIKTSDGRCLFVDILSGDFRANLTPVQIADCGTTDGQGWDVITAGIHNDQPGQVLVVSTLTQACLNFDPRRQPGNQVLLFSCGGRADGGGQVTGSQLFAFDGGAGPLSLTPRDAQGSCLATAGNVIDIANCADGAAEQSFTFGDGAGNDGGNGNDNDNEGDNQEPAPTEDNDNAPAPTSTEAAASTTAAAPAITEAPDADAPAAPGEPVAVSRGGFLQQDAVEEAHKFDGTAVRALQSINIRASDGRCLSIDTTAGDFRQNLIPVAMVECQSVRNQKFDIITSGVHNNGRDGRVLVASNLTEGCISFDGRRAVGDTVNLFSCGGRADGGGETDFAQLFPFDAESDNMILEPQNGNGDICLVAGDERVDSAPCTGDNDQVWELVAVL
ncbi:hypothetical protein B0I35DRAFT_483393 [Stachybotrys elegans]|uniref:Ricin B lectin domain-containing protein n=1 Tax=Stachybotrys elegans TaxID=80388 RepID=A0A8K0SCC3_9HYPO|nr:hypothetical protein B0I35DRAFT_483393 [Stachybotrys elegans]